MKNQATLLFGIVLSLQSSIALSQAPTDSLSSLDWIIGKWYIEAFEDDSDSSSYKESGFQDCSWVLNNRAIRCDTYVSRNKTSGRYINLSKSNSSIVYIIYNKRDQQFEQIRIGTSGTRTQAFTKTDSRTLKAKSSFIHSSLGFKMFNDISISKVNDDLIIWIEDLTNEDGTFTEWYESKMLRIE